MRAAVVLILLAPALAGCLDVPPQGGPVTGSQESSGYLEPACPPVSVHPGNGICVAWLNPVGTTGLEASLATHPFDSSIVLVSWTGRKADVQDVYAAMSQDGGASWQVAQLRGDRQPLVTAAGQGNGGGFDSTAAFTRDGRPLVAFGEADGGAVEGNHITVASSDDVGASWQYARLDSAGRQWDYMMIAASPDTDDVFVVSQHGLRDPQTLGAHLFRSRDGGTTWSTATELRPTLNQQGMAQHPRIAVAAGGLVAVTYKIWPPDPLTFFVMTSFDHGETFGEGKFLYATEPGDYGQGNPLVLGPLRTGANAFDAFIARSDAATLFVADASGETWAQEELAPIPPGEAHWGMAVRDATGTLYGLFEYSGGNHWGVGLVETPADVVPRVTTLAESSTIAAPPVAGNEYGGLAIASDGTLWAAWADPRLKDGPHVAIAHFAPAA